VLVLDTGRDAAPVAASACEGDGTAPEKDATEVRKSIVVLPFVNMSDDPANEYFSDGISEELLNLLTRVSQLRVIARTSSFAFKGKDVSIAGIARELQVDHVLEGSVRKEGNRVRIMAQLIRTADSSHLWSASYDRTLDNIFSIQEQIAAEVVAQLKVTLLGAVPTVQETDPDAYALVLQARFFSNQGTPAGWDQAAALYEQALAIDSNYAAAWLGLSFVKSNQRLFGLLPTEDAMEEAVKRALAIDPASAAAHLLLAYDAMRTGAIAVAATHLRRTLQLEPANPEALLAAAALLNQLGRPAEGLQITQYIVSVDPVNPYQHRLLGAQYARLGQHENAIAALAAIAAQDWHGARVVGED